ncbi:MAG: PAS domain S-box protein [Nitrospiraceae bacterium]|nr:MAG: PAS domain S-box protein [Nitrospiraceae bacterium]
MNALIVIRVVVVTILLDSFYIFRIGYDRISRTGELPYFIAALYFLTVIYALALRRIKTDHQFALFAYVQIVGDTVAEAVLIYLTGGIESMFSLMFPLSILSAGIILNRRACYIVATVSSALYGLLINFQYHGIVDIKTALSHTDRDFLYTIFAHITAFYLVAFLSGYLSEKLHRATQSLEERDTVLSDLKAFSRYIIESMPSGIFTTDLNKRIISFNTAARDITQLSHADVAGKTPEEIFPFLGTARGTAERVEGEFLQGGKICTIGMRLSKLKDSSGKPIGMIGVFQDLTELKAMEAEVKRKEKWAFIGELSASIAHELRNPLASLKGSVEMLRERRVSEEHAEQLMSIALSEMDRLNGIITDFLLYAKPQELSREPFDLNQSLKDVIMLLERSESKGEHVRIATHLEGSFMMTGDSRKIQQVFWNLGVNALDAVSAGGVIDVVTRKGGGTAEVIFRDNGRGIDPADIDKVFYPFFTTRERGTGLGLSIAQKIIEDHGGKIVVESGGPGTGAAFRVFLPARGGQDGMLGEKQE